MKKASRILCAVGASLMTTNAWSALTLWIDDSDGNIGTVDVATGTTTVIGNAGVVLTDIAFDPLGNLFGVSFTNFYSISKATGAATSIGALGAGIHAANALVFRSDGTLYLADSITTDLYTVNTGTGAATSLGSTGFSSSGDLAFNGGDLYLSATTDQLVRIDLNNLASSAAVGSFGVSSVLGLATADNGLLYGVSGAQVFSVDTSTGAGTLVTNYEGGALLSAYGSAFFTEAGATVPEPGTLSLVGLAFAGFFTSRKRGQPVARRMGRAQRNPSVRAPAFPLA